MKGIFTLITLSFVTTGVLATEGPTCTEASTDTWMSETAFVTMASDLGYATDGFTVTEGNCYALTRMDGPAGAMDYFNPVTGAVVQ